MAPAGDGSISGPEATAENGLPTNTIVSAPASAPALPNSDAEARDDRRDASTVRLSTPALTSQSPPTTSSQLWTIAVGDEAGQDRAGRDDPGAPHRAGGRGEREHPGEDAGDDQREQRRGQRAARRLAGATSSISTAAPLSLAAWVSICVTAGLAAEAVSSLPPANAP